MPPNGRTLKIGRVATIIELLKKEFGVDSMRRIAPEKKLDALCSVLQFDYSQFDELLSTNSEVLRTIRGHAFESFFDRLLQEAGYEVVRVGGDDARDRSVNGYYLQLKTPYSAGTKDGIVSYKTHKTHGAKSERESIEYYHLLDEFPDFLVGLVTYDPLVIVVLPREGLPRHVKESKRILSPFGIRLSDYEGLSSLSLIGVDPKRLQSFQHLLAKPKGELLPRTAKSVGVTTDIILDTILSEENFRIWDMNIRGFAAELSFKFLLDRNNIQYFSPLITGRQRADKSDLAIVFREKNVAKLLQIKGPSLRGCRLNGQNSMVDIETQLTRGRVVDHPTQSRLYLFTDWDFLIVSLLPDLAAAYRDETKMASSGGWEHYSISTSYLTAHHIMKHRIASHQKFTFDELQQYKIDEAWCELWKKGGSEQIRLAGFEDSIVGDD